MYVFSGSGDVGRPPLGQRTITPGVSSFIRDRKRFPRPRQPSSPRSLPPARNGLRPHKIIRRNGAVVGFEHSKISIAMTKASSRERVPRGLRARAASRCEADRGVVARYPAPPGGRHVSNRGNPGTGQLALCARRAQRSARLRAHREERAKERARRVRSGTAPRARERERGGLLKPPISQAAALVREECEGQGREVSAAPCSPREARS